jgi:hypothetical protein
LEFFGVGINPDFIRRRRFVISASRENRVLPKRGNASYLGALRGVGRSCAEYLSQVSRFRVDTDFSFAETATRFRTLREEDKKPC